MKQNYFKIFSKKHIWLYLTLASLLVIATFFLIAVFSDWFHSFEKLNDFGVWASYIAAVLTYIGSALISVVVYYNTWIEQYKEEQLDYSIDFSAFCDNEIKQFASLDEFSESKKQYFYEYSDGDLLERKNYEYKEFIIRNYNKTYPLSIEILQVNLTIDENPTIDCTNDIAVATNFDYHDSLDSCIKYSLLLGINESLLKAWHSPDDYHSYNLDIIFQFGNSVGNKVLIQYSLKNNDSEIHQKELSKNQIKKLSLKSYALYRTHTIIYKD